MDSDLGRRTSEGTGFVPENSRQSSSPRTETEYLCQYVSFTTDIGDSVQDSRNGLPTFTPACLKIQE